MRKRSKCIVTDTILCGWLILCPAPGLRASITAVQLTPSVPSPQPVGTSITWNAGASDSNPGSLTYQFQVALSGAPFRVVRDYSLSPTFTWTPSQQEGAYAVQVVVRNYASGESVSNVQNFVITSRLPNNAVKAVATATANPLVALLSAPSCPAGSTMQILFQSVAGGPVSTTNARPCHPPASMNFYIAGMTPSTTYKMTPVLQTNGAVTTYSPVTFTTGWPTVPMPTNNLLIPPGQDADTQNGILLHAYFDAWGFHGFPVATNLRGIALWYLPPSQAGHDLLVRPVEGGTMLMIGSGLPSGTGLSRATEPAFQLLREIDLAGNTVRETNTGRVSEQLMAAGADPISSFSHDAIRLPNGYTAVLAQVERVYPAGTQGSLQPVNILGDMLVVLDANWQVAWHWNAFDHAGGAPQLDINRPALLGETCRNFLTPQGCGPLFLASSANDWLHSNSVQYIASSGDFLISVRHQDWLIRIDYRNGAGTGNVLWRMGRQGDFNFRSSDPYPWFSHQHDAAFEEGGTLLSVFDNGNTRQAVPFVTHNSRGQVLSVDEASMTVTLLVNADLGIYSSALGSAHSLANGNWLFQAGIAGPIGGDFASFAIQSNSAGRAVYDMQGIPSYRAWQMKTLYAPPAS